MKMIANAGKKTLAMPNDAPAELALIAIAVQKQPNWGMLMPAAIDDLLVGS